jgi:hypothetical protein
MLPFANVGFAQDSVARNLSRKGYQRYFSIGVGALHHSLYDDAMSPVRYRGTSLAPHLGHIKTNERKYSQWDIHASFMKYKTPLSNKLVPMKMTSVRFGTDYQRLQRVAKWSRKMDVHIGGASSLLFHFRQAPQLDNSQLVYEYAFSAGFAGMVSKDVKALGRDWRLRYQLQIPLLAYFYRPPYMNRVEFFNPENELIGYTLRNSSAGTVNRYLRINSVLSATRTLRNGNAVRIGYGWDFYRMKTINRVFHTEHLASFSFLPAY